MAIEKRQGAAGACPHNGMLLLQHEQDRYETYRSLTPWRHDTELDCICVFDAELISAIFRSDAFHVIDYRAAYQRIMERTGIELGAILNALSHIPLANEGGAHKQLRNDIAAVLGVGLRMHRTEITDAVGAAVAKAFRPGRRVDLVDDVFVPAYKAVFGLVFGIDHARIETDPMISQIFDRTISLNRRKKMQSAITALGASLDRHSEEGAIDRNLAVALTILGHDAMIGSLSLSAWHVFRSNDGAMSSGIEFPDLLPATSVPYIERVAAAETTVGDLTVDKGQRVRLYMDAASGRAADGDDPDLFFGRGRHLCLGKPITLGVWQAFKSAVATLDRPIFAEELNVRSKDYVFTYPEHAWIRIAD